MSARSKTKSRLGLVLGVVLACCPLGCGRVTPPAGTITYAALATEVEQGNVKRVTFGDEWATVTMKSGDEVLTIEFGNSTTEPPILMKLLQDNAVEYQIQG